MKKYSEYTREELIEECVNSKIESTYLYGKITEILTTLKGITDSSKEPFILKLVENEGFKTKFNLDF